MEERRENCAKYQGIVDDLKSAVFGNGRPGIREDIVTMKSKLTILMSLQIGSTIALISAGVKIVFFTGV